MRRTERRGGTGGTKLRGREGSAKPLPLLQAVWEQVGGEIFSSPSTVGTATPAGRDDVAAERALGCTNIAEDSLDAAGVDLWGPVAVAAPGDGCDTARQARVIGERLDRIGAIVLDVRGTWCAGPEWACGLLVALRRFRALGRDCLVAAGRDVGRVRALPGVPEGFVFDTVEEAVWVGLQIAGG